MYLLTKFEVSRTFHAKNIDVSFLGFVCEVSVPPPLPPQTNCIPENSEVFVANSKNSAVFSYGAGGLDHRYNDFI